MRSKTTLWGFPTDTASVANSTNRNFAVQTVYAETNSRVIKSAIIEVYCQDVCTATGNTLGELRVQVSFDNVTWSASPVGYELDDYTTSGEALGILYGFDFTAFFIANFGALATKTVYIRNFWTLSGGTGLTTINSCALLKLTYEFDDAATNCLKTMIIPLGSVQSNADIPSTLGTNMGTDQIPILTGASGIIREVTNPTIRDYFFLIEGNENDVGGTVDFQMLTRIDTAGATFTSGLIERALGSDKAFRFIWSLKGANPNTTLVHNFQVATAVNGFAHFCVKLVITYEFTRASAVGTSVSIQLPFRMQDIGATTAADQQVIRIPFDIEEPGAITLRQSGVALHWCVSGAMATAGVPTIQVGAQTARAYTSGLAAGSICGEESALQRFDAGAIGGVGATLQRGKSYVDVKVFSSARATIAGVGGVLYLNYSTDAVPATGIDTANHTIWNTIVDTDFSLPVQYLEVAATAPAYIADPDYAIQWASGWVIKYWHGTTGVAWACLYVEILAGEGNLGVADGWQILDAFRPAVFAEVGYYQCAADCWDVFKRWPGDPKANQMNIESARKWRLYSTRGSCGIQFCVTYHSITYTGTKAITEFTGTGALPVKIHDYTSGELLYEVTSAVGGVYTYKCYDNTRQLISRVYESSSGLSGASEPWTPI
jgi:hypothetical protein